MQPVAAGRAGLPEPGSSGTGLFAPVRDFNGARGQELGQREASILLALARADVHLPFGGFLLALLAGRVYDATGSFSFAYYCSAALLAVAAVATFVVRPVRHPQVP